MKKITADTVLIVFVLIMASLLSSCRARKVALLKTDSTTVHSSEVKTSSAETHIDTGKVTVSKAGTVNQVIQAEDSTVEWQQLIPEPNTVVTIDADGTIHLTVKEINTRRTVNQKSTTILNSSLQERTSEAKGIADTKQENSSANSHDSTRVEKKQKTVDAKPSFGAWPWIAGLVALGALALTLWWFFGKPKS